jgi:hypothetical protein
MNYQSDHDWLEDLQSQDNDELASLKAENDKLRRENSLYVDATDRFFGIPQNLSAYHRARALEKAGKMSLEASALDEEAQELGYRTARRALYALGKMKSSGQSIPDEFSVVPDEFITYKVSSTKAQTQWKKILPVLNELWDDDTLDEQDLADFKERVSECKGDFESFADYILGVRRRELRGEFKKEIEETAELMTQRLASANERLQLTATTHFETATGLLPAAKQSHDIKFDETGIATPISDLAQQQMNELSEEDQEFALSMGFI